MRVRLDYGKQGLDVELPEKNVVGVLNLTAARPLADEARAVRAALEAPIASEALRKVARGRRTACVVVCDITRPVPNKLVVPEVLAELALEGISGGIRVYPDCDGNPPAEHARGA